MPPCPSCGADQWSGMVCCDNGWRQLHADAMTELREARAEVALMRQEIESQERAHAEVIARHVALHRYNQRAHSGCVAARAKLHQALRHTGLMRGDLVREAIELLAVGTGLPVQN